MLPMVSVVIPMRNERKHIAACLLSLVNSDYPEECLEILAVDGMSEDGTRDLVSELSKQYATIRLLQNPKTITPVGMNIGIRNSRGRYILILGAHSECPPGFLNAAVRCIQEVKADVVGGPWITLSGGESLISKAIAAALTHRFGVGGSRFRTNPNFEGYVHSVPYGLFKRETFDKFGYFDEKLIRNQDNELFARFRAGGGRVYMSRALAVRYYADENLRAFCSKSFKTGFWNVKTFLDGFGGMSARHFAPGLFVAAVSVLGLGSLAFRPLGLALLALLAAYFACAIGATLHLVFQRQSASLLVLPFFFLVLHLSYGLGSLFGLTVAFWSGYAPQTR